MGRRVWKSKADLREEKRLYDIEYRKKHRRKLRKKKKEWFAKHYSENPELYKEKRKRKKKYQSRYIQTPEYKRYKQGYDEKYRAKKVYGVFAESFLIIKKIEKIVDKKQSRFDRDCHNKTQKRKRLWKRSSTQ